LRRSSCGCHLAEVDFAERQTEVRGACYPRENIAYHVGITVVQMVLLRMLDIVTVHMFRPAVFCYWAVIFVPSVFPCIATLQLPHPSCTPTYSLRPTTSPPNVVVRSEMVHCKEVVVPLFNG
jgi:hypothetical protein